MMHRLLVALAPLLLIGCFDHHSDGPAPGVDSGPRDAGLDAGRPDLFPDSGLPDAGGCFFDRGDEYRLLFEEAECIGLTDPTCADCHQRPDGWVLRPRADGTPPPPFPSVLDPSCIVCE